jgi:hypothetical protein
VRRYVYMRKLFLALKFHDEPPYARFFRRANMPLVGRTWSLAALSGGGAGFAGFFPSSFAISEEASG